MSIFSLFFFFLTSEDFIDRNMSILKGDTKEL